MRLVTNWRRVLARAWSVRLIAAAAVLSGLEVALPLLGDALPVPPGVLAALSFIVVVLAFVARLCVQKGITDE